MKPERKTQFPKGDRNSTNRDYFRPLSSLTSNAQGGPPKKENLKRRKTKGRKKKMGGNHPGTSSEGKEKGDTQTLRRGGGKKRPKRTFPGLIAVGGDERRRAISEKTECITNRGGYFRGSLGIKIGKGQIQRPGSKRRNWESKK